MEHSTLSKTGEPVVIMDPRELRIGNILSYGTNPDPKENLIVTVKTIGEDGINHQAIYDEDFPDNEPHIRFYEYEVLNPIPLTSEWLERMGFAMGEHFSYNGLRLSLKFARWDPQQGFLQLDSPFGSTILYFLHQIQNWFFALTGQELEIKELV